MERDSICENSRKHQFSLQSLLKVANHNVILGFVVLLAERDDRLNSVF
jgi:hypothetical protein